MLQKISYILHFVCVCEKYNICEIGHAVVINYKNVFIKPYKTDAFECCNIY